MTCSFDELGSLMISSSVVRRSSVSGISRAGAASVWLPSWRSIVSAPAA